MKKTQKPEDRPWFVPDIETLRRISGSARPVSENDARDLLAETGRTLEPAEIAALLRSMLSSRDSRVTALVLERATELRRELFGNVVVPMAPVEVANHCASDCAFCGWRISNREMKRLRLPSDLIMAQVEYLVDLGIHYIEFVGGDDRVAVREDLPLLVQETRHLFEQRGIDGRICFCTMALTERQYRDLTEYGADSMIVWQETYDPDVFRHYITSGPKANGIDEKWHVVSGGDGYRFRVESQERALRAGLAVAMGSMLGLNPDMCTEFLATVEHARYLARTYGASAARPIIIGMPIWNPITTSRTDMRPTETPDVAGLFPALAALYLLSLPSEGTWVFPNCRVSMDAQIEAARVAGVFSSTEVKLGPGGYLPAMIQRKRARGESADSLEQRVRELLTEHPDSLEELARSLDEREQFLHHYHSHETYREAMERAGLHLLTGVSIADGARSGR